MSHLRPILVDERVGSKDLLEPLRDAHLPAYEMKLDFGDVAFEGNGPDGPLMVGIERKKVRDLIDSMRSGRLAGHQLIGLLHDYQVNYLVVEGSCRPGPNTGVLEVPVRGGWEPLRLGTTGFPYSELEGFLLGLENRAGVKVRWTYNRAQTVSLIQTMWTWWGVPWDSHRSLNIVYNPAPPTVEFLKPTLERKVAVQLDGIGWEKSKQVAERFSSVAAMVGASEKEWMEIDGIGKTLAKRIVRALNGQKESN